MLLLPMVGLENKVSTKTGHGELGFGKNCKCNTQWCCGLEQSPLLILPMVGGGFGEHYRYKNASWVIWIWDNYPSRSVNGAVVWNKIFTPLRML